MSKLGIITMLAALGSTADAGKLEPTPSIITRDCERDAACYAKLFADALFAASEPRELRLDSVVTFEPGTARVYSVSRERLQKVADDWKRQTSWTRIIVEGYAGPSAASSELAQKRADLIRHYLIKYGVEENFVVSIGRAQMAGRVQGRVDLTIELL